MLRKKKKGFFGSPKKQDNPADTYLTQLSGMLKRKGSILVPKAAETARSRPAASAPAPTAKPEPELAPQVTSPAPAPAPKPATRDPASAPFTIFKYPIASGQASEAPAPNSQDVAAPAEPNAPQSAPDSKASEHPNGFIEGAILKWRGPTLGIFKKHEPQKGFDVIYVLSPSGKMTSQGLALYSYNAQQIGLLPEDVLRSLEKKMTWERDIFVFHLFDFADSKHLPHVVPDRPPSPKPVAPAAHPIASPPRPGASKLRINTLQRGTRISMCIRNQVWNAVYWGKDQQGSVVAHNADRGWTLIHIDLEEFKERLVIQDVMDKRELLQLERNLHRSGAIRA